MAAAKNCVSPANPKKKGGSKKNEKAEKKPKRVSNLPSLSSFSIPIAIIALALAIGARNMYRKKNVNAKPTSAPPPEFKAKKVEEQVKVKVQGNKLENGPPDPQLHTFVYIACRVAECHESLVLSGRSFRAREKIPVGEVLVKVPRKMQIRDLDALRDPFIREHLFRATHKITGNHLGSGAFLAAYLAIQINKLKISPNDVHPLQRAYLEMLPKYEDLMYHPVLWEEDELREKLGPHSAALAASTSTRNMVYSEYQAMALAPEFAEMVNEEDYVAARINVLSRSFKTGPPGPEEVVPASFLSDELGDLDLLKDELEAYQDLLGIDMMNANIGCLAMVPILDLFNHHPTNHVTFKGGTMLAGDSAFTADVTRFAVEEGREPMATYGDTPDSTLFARYGFVNGDGSGGILATLAVNHHVLTPQLFPQYSELPFSGSTEKIRSEQSLSVKKYLDFDDGYERCIAGPTSHPEQVELKRLKFEHLMKIANIPERWETIFPPRNPNSEPAESFDVQITKDLPFFEREQLAAAYNMDAIHATCRMMSILETDFGGTAAEMLRHHLDTVNYFLPNGNDSFEFRSLMCVARWSGTGLVRQELMSNAAEAFRQTGRLNEYDYGSKAWTAAHVRMGEMQALQALTNLIMETATKFWKDKKHNPPPEYKMRDTACPSEDSNYLLEQSTLLGLKN
jgi:hypothetical protein